jgi:hypothetical protein
MAVYMDSDTHCMTLRPNWLSIYLTEWSKVLVENPVVAQLLNGNRSTPSHRTHMEDNMSDISVNIKYK